MKSPNFANVINSPSPCQPTINQPTLLDPNRLLRLREVIALIPVAKSTWWGWVASGVAPQPIRLGRTTAWRYSDLLEFINHGVSQERG